MEQDNSKVRGEAQAWCVGTLLAVALIVYTAWHGVRRNESLSLEAHSTEQVAPTSK